MIFFSFVPLYNEKSFLQRLEHFAKGMHKGCMSPTINVVVLKATFLALFGVKEEEEESFFFSIKNNIKSKVRAPSCHNWIYKLKQFFAKEFVQKLNRLNNSIPCLDHVKLSSKVPWVVGTLYQLGVETWLFLVVGIWDFEDAFKVVNKLGNLFVVFIFCAMDFFPFVYPPNKKHFFFLFKNQQQQELVKLKLIENKILLRGSKQPLEMKTKG